jgi:hypothetical protein
VVIAVGASGNLSDAAITILGTAVFAVAMLTFVRRLLSKVWSLGRAGRRGIRRDAMAIV